MSSPQASDFFHSLWFQDTKPSKINIDKLWRVGAESRIHGQRRAGMGMTHGHQSLESKLRELAGRFAGVAVFVSLLSTPASLWAQQAKKLPFPYSPIGLNCLPWFVAKDARIFDKHGIEFDPVFIGASSALFNAMLSG